MGKKYMYHARLKEKEHYLLYFPIELSLREIVFIASVHTLICTC